MEKHGDDLPGRSITKELPEPLLVPGDAVAIDQGDEVFGRKAAQCRFGEVRVG
jgi:hypothetical protein